MTLKHFASNGPFLASAIISIVIVIAGIIGLASLPVEQYPGYRAFRDGDGARHLSGRQRRNDPEVFGDRTPEEAINGGEHDVHSVRSLESRQRLDHGLFPPGTDLITQAVNVQNRPGHGQLPGEDADRRDDHEASDSMLKVISISA